MSKKKNRNQNSKIVRTEKDTKNKFFIPLYQWEKFERFTESIVDLEDILIDLQDRWDSHICFLMDELQCTKLDFIEIDDVVKNTITIIINLIQGISSKRNKYNYCDQYSNHIDYHPKDKYNNMMAEIIIEDISDGKL